MYIMVNLYPSLYTFGASSCGALTIIPLDILQTKIMSNKPIEFKIEELKFVLLFSILFAIQNNIYNFTSSINNKSIRALLAGISSVPIYVLLEIQKIYSRLGLKPKINNFTFWIIIRQIMVFTSLYNIIEMNFLYSNFIGALFANCIGFPLRIIAFKKGYPNLKFDKKNIKKIGFIEIVKSSIADNIILYLIYNFKYSPLKI